MMADSYHITRITLYAFRRHKYIYRNVLFAMSALELHDHSAQKLMEGHLAYVWAVGNLSLTSMVVTNGPGTWTSGHK